MTTQTEGEGKRMQPVQYYGCVQCQANHFEDTDAAIYRQHIMRQSKHGVRQFYETLEERKRRYELEPANAK